VGDGLSLLLHPYLYLGRAANVEVKGVENGDDIMTVDTHKDMTADGYNLKRWSVVDVAGRAR
jgi:hypothetical protein